MSQINISTNNLVLKSTYNTLGKNVLYKNNEIFNTQSNLFVINGDLIINSDYNNHDTSGTIIFPTISQIQGDLILENNTLIHVLRFTNLQNITGSIKINNNSTLNEISMPLLITIGGSLQIMNNSITGTTDSSTSTITNLHIIHFPLLTSIGIAPTISNNNLGKTSTNSDGTVIDLIDGLLIFPKLTKIGIDKPFTYNQTTVKTLNVTRRSGEQLVYTLSTTGLVPPESNRTFKLGMIFKPATMTQGNDFTISRNIYKSNEKWLGTPAYKFTNLTEAQKSKPIITQTTGSSSDYMRLRKSRAIGDNTTKFGSLVDKSILFANNNSNDVNSATRRVRN